MREDIETVISKINTLSIVSQTASTQRDRFLRRFDVVHDKGVGVFDAEDDLRLIAELYEVDPVPLVGVGNRIFIGPDENPVEMREYKTSPGMRWIEEIGVCVSIPKVQLHKDVPKNTQLQYLQAVQNQTSPPIRQVEYFMETIVIMHPSQQTLDSWKNKERHTDPVIAHLENTYDRPFWHAKSRATASAES